MRRVTGALAAGLVLVGGATATAGAARAADAGGLDGLWRSDGYATSYAVHDGSIRSYQTTQISCQPGPTYRRRGAGFTAGDGEDFTVRRTGPDTARLHWAGSAGDVTLRRTDRLPAHCGQSIPDSPQRTFDIFWQTMRDNYPFFTRQGVDWAALRERYRPGVTAANLHDRLCSMIAPLHDNHVYVAGPDGPPCFQVRPGTVEPGPELEKRVVGLIERRDLHGPMRTWADGRIGFRRLPGDVGYLRLSSFADFTDAGTYPADAALLDRVLDVALGGRPLRGLMIDVRVNGGGSDALGLQIAGRLTDRPYLAYAKRVQRRPGQFTVPQSIWVRPAAGRSRFTGRLAVLTGGSDVSAGETFVQALLARPNTVRVGANTQGVFSDVLERTLPDGQSFGLPDEEFRTATGRTFDGVGIPPQIPTPVFTEAEFQHDRDSAFDTARALLTGRVN